MVNGLLDIFGNLGQDIRAAGATQGQESVLESLLRGRRVREEQAKQEQLRLLQQQALEQSGFGGLAPLAGAGVPLGDITKLAEQQRLGKTGRRRQQMIEQLLGAPSAAPVTTPPIVPSQAAPVGAPAPTAPPVTTPPIVPDFSQERNIAQALLLDPATSALGQARMADIRAREQEQRQIAKELRAPKIEERKAIAKERAQAVIDLPLVEDQSVEAINLIDELMEHPGFSVSVGASVQPFARFIPGSDAADFQARFEQVKGKQFLEAFQSLKGGGQITEVEGKKATQAISRMDTAQSEKEFKKAAKVFQSVIKRGLERARKATGLDAEQRQISLGATRSIAPAPVQGVPTRRFNPQTGQFEVIQ